MSLADQHLLRGLLALQALDARLHKNRAFYRLKNRFLEAVARRPDANVVDFVDADRTLWIAVSLQGFAFRMPAVLATKELRARACFVMATPVLTEPVAGDVDVDAEMRALDEAGRALNGNKVAPPARAASAGASA